MDRSKFTGILLFLFVFISINILGLQILGQNQEKIIEKVVVETAELPVRVFHKNNIVGSLQKEDFRLYIGGKDTKIKGFYKIRRKLENLPTLELQKTGIPPRLFVLIFNVCDYRLDLVSVVETLFRDIIGLKDRYMLITNHFFFPEREIFDLKKEKANINRILGKELKRLKSEIIWYENELKAIAINLKSRLNSPVPDPEFPAGIMKEFFMRYEFVLEDMRDKYLNLPVSHYLKIAGYLKGLKADKWILNFYQIGQFPMINEFGKLGQVLREYLFKSDPASRKRKEQKALGSAWDDVYPGRNKMRIKTMMNDLYAKVTRIDNIQTEDINKMFINSGATVHTLLLKAAIPWFSDDYKYEAVSTDSEIILKSLTELTGGDIVRSNKVDDFVDKISLKEDNIYVLAYSPETGKRKNAKIKVEVRNKDYQVVYDNQKRSGYLRRIMEILDQYNPDIEIDKIYFGKDVLTVKLKNLKLVDSEGEYFGMVRARIKILDEKSNIISDFEKLYRGIREEGIFFVKLPELAKGNFKIVIEVKDVYSLKSTAAGTSIDVFR